MGNWALVRLDGSKTQFQKMTMSLKLTFLFLMLDIVASESKTSEDVLRELHSKFAKYNKDLRPDIGGDPVKVIVSIDVLSITEVSAKKMEFTLDINLTESWNDSRLTFEGNEAVREIVLGVEKMEEIWRPDTFFQNKKSSPYRGPDSDSDSYMKIDQNGTILVTKRLTLTADCPMYFWEYPMDSQQCTLDLSSFSHTFSDISYEWKDGNQFLPFSPPVSLPNYSVLGLRQLDAPTPSYSGLMVRMQFVRAYGHNIKYHFIPAAFMVSLSWLSLLLDPEKTLARLSLCLAPLLTLLFLSLQAGQDLPPLSYWTAVDIYLCCCCTAVTAAILVTIVSSSWGRMRGYQGLETGGAGEDGEEKNAGDRSEPTGSQLWRKVDCGFIIILPVLFLVFNIAFWGYYGGARHVDGSDEVKLIT